MNPVFALARELQTPSAKFEASNALAKEILWELEERERMDALEVAEAMKESDSVQRSSYNDDDWYTYNTETLELQAGRGAHYERPTQPAAPLKTVRGMTAKYLGLWQYKAVTV